MKKIIFFILLLTFSSKVHAQKKVSDTLFLDCFDFMGNRHGFSKMFDHIATKKDTEAFYRQASIDCDKVADSLKHAMGLKNRMHKKKTRTKATPK